ncbi:hypothetical protein F5884DRAFT_753021 [Xylogone sp. PMI_703]|nr:hypothetical protein F5884DRAFT_753021 [Xylogone sp. PMI_703]
MVYCGIASKGCSNCRKRRIKCDLRETGCSQCMRVDKPCPGYRDALSLMFRDESDRIIKKVYKGRKRHTGDDRQSSTSPSPPSLSLSPSPPLLPGEKFLASPLESCLEFCKPDAPLEHQGISFFFTHYSTLIAVNQKSPLKTIRMSLWNEVATNEMAFDAVSCVGLAGLANVKNDERYMVLAREKYAAIIRQVMEVLPNPQQNDEKLGHTFKAIILLSAFEMVNATPDNISSWRIHLEGAAALLRKVLPRDNPHMPNARIQLQFLIHTCVSYAQSGQTFPEYHQELFFQNQQAQAEADKPAAVLLSLAIRLVQISASLHAREVIDPLLTICEALSLEADLGAWFSSLPPHWKYPTKSTMPEERDSLINFNGEYHVYSDPWSSRIYNNYRWIRIMVNDIILTYLARIAPTSLSVDYSLVQQKSLAVIFSLATDTCISVISQYYLAMDRTLNSLGPQMNGIFLIIWPLMIAASGIGVSEDIAEFCIRNLEHIAMHDGVMRALTSVKVVKERRKAWIEKGLHVLRTY